MLSQCTCGVWSVSLLTKVTTVGKWGGCLDLWYGDCNTLTVHFAIWLGYSLVPRLSHARTKIERKGDT